MTVSSGKYDKINLYLDSDSCLIRCPDVWICGTIDKPLWLSCVSGHITPCITFLPSLWIYLFFAPQVSGSQNKTHLSCVPGGRNASLFKVCLKWRKIQVNSLSLECRFWECKHGAGRRLFTHAPCEVSTSQTWSLSDKQDAEPCGWMSLCSSLLAVCIHTRPQSHNASCDQ